MMFLSRSIRIVAIIGFIFGALTLTAGNNSPLYVFWANPLLTALVLFVALVLFACGAIWALVLNFLGGTETDPYAHATLGMLPAVLSIYFGIVLGIKFGFLHTFAQEGGLSAAGFWTLVFLMLVLGLFTLALMLDFHEGDWPRPRATSLEDSAAPS
jgi:hypothetical protein